MPSLVIGGGILKALAGQVLAADLAAVIFPTIAS